MKKLIVIVHYSFKDPLFYGNLFQYLKYYGKSKEADIILITYESNKFKLNKIEINKIKSDLKSNYNIKWISLTWKTHPYNIIRILRKLYEFLTAFLIITYYRFFGSYDKIMTLGTTIGSVVYLISRILKMKFLIYQYEPHSEYMLDAKLVSKTSKEFRVLNFLEYKIGVEADFIITTTNHMIDRLKKIRKKENVFLVRSCVDDVLFKFDIDVRNNLRTKFGISKEEKVIIYAGKFGDLYYSSEMPIFLKAFKELNPFIKIIIISLQDREFIQNIFRKVGWMDDEYILITNVLYPHIKDYYSMGDLGIVAVPPTPSKKFTSSIKVGEYLCCGLPYIICRGIGEDDIIAEKYNVGVVLNDLNEVELKNNYTKINQFLNENRYALASRCREVGLKYRGFSNLNSQMKIILNRFLEDNS